ncbi:MAG: alpha/beta hydrolase [Pseudomonadota bacterium]
MNLEPEIEAFISKTECFYTNNACGNITEERNAYNALCREFTPPVPEDLHTRDELIRGKKSEIPVRCYWTENTSDACLIYFHGGGFVVGNLDSHDFVCMRLAMDTTCKVIAVDYRLAPEHRFPAAFDDCASVLQSVQNRADRFGVNQSKILLCGDSAGGNLVAGVALANRDNGGTALLGQIMVYPRLTHDYSLPSYTECANAPLLSTEDVHYYHDAYTNREKIDSHYLAPATARSFSDLPPALLLPVEYDPLRDDSYLYHEKLLAARVESELHLGKGLVHGCLRAIGASPQADLMYAKILDFVNRQVN